MAAKYQNKKVYQLSFESVCNAFRGVGVIKRLDFGFKSESVVGESRVFNLSSDINLASWGEKITVTVTAVDSGVCVDVLSECALPTQIIDWGKNQKNVEAVFGFLDANAPTLAACAPAENNECGNKCYCANCGTQIEKTDLFCYKCGTRNGLANEKGN